MKQETDSPATDVGVIVGRFQVHQLHEAHIELIEHVRSRHDKTLIFIGLSPLRNTSKNPMDFSTRATMIRESFPDVDVLYIEDSRSDETWSRNLDRLIEKWTKPHQTVTLYGSRDSFIPRYHGKYDTVELSSTRYISGTEIRRKIANTFTKGLEYRAGLIAASFDRYPTAYTTVDIAIFSHDYEKVLLGKKPGEDKLRFVGGFATPNSYSFEEDAVREAKEETGLDIDNLQYVGSCKINDWRYAGEQDKIKTVFFAADCPVDSRPEAADDIEYVQWVDIDTLLAVPTTVVVDEHVPLVDILKTFMTKQGW